MATAIADQPAALVVVEPNAGRHADILGQPDEDSDEAVQTGEIEIRGRAVRRVERELRRLDALAARRRIRTGILRLLRGSAGAGTTLWTLVKLKLAGSLVFKVVLAAMVGLGLAWPLMTLAILAVLGVMLAIVSLLSGEGGPHDLSCDCPCDCATKEKRAERLRLLIERRKAWLAAPTDPAPSLLREAAGRHLGTSRQRK